MTRRELIVRIALVVLIGAAVGAAIGAAIAALDPIDPGPRPKLVIVPTR